MVEYAVLLGLVTAVLVTAITTLSGNLNTLFTSVSTVISNSNTGVAGG